MVRHLIAIFALPFMVVIVVPAMVVLALSEYDTRWTLTGVLAFIPIGIGLFFFLGGLLLVAWCIRLFARLGTGTLAPWDPPKRLVIAGPYRHVRNPMISGVLAMLLGESITIGSSFLLAWAIGFWLLNLVYFLIFEEPGLDRRFGYAYKRYRAEVRRWIPRRSPWTAADEATGDGSGESTPPNTGT